MNTEERGRSPEELLPCPFCGAPAERIDIEDGENAGGSCIECTRCQASSNVEFGYKEHFVSNWNRRALPLLTGGDERGELREIAAGDLRAAVTWLGQLALDYDAAGADIHCATVTRLARQFEAALAPTPEHNLPPLSEAAGRAALGIVDDGFPAPTPAAGEKITEGRRLQREAQDEAFLPLPLHGPWPARTAWAKWLYDNGPALLDALERAPTAPPPNVREAVEALEEATGATAIIRNGLIVISVAVDALPLIVSGSIADRNIAGGYIVTDAAAFAKDVVAALNAENERGETEVHRMFDRAFDAAVNQGADGVTECTEEEFEAEAYRLQHAAPRALASLKGNAPAGAGERADRQKRIGQWCRDAFGDRHATSLPDRGIRLLEEAIELAQSCGCDPAMAHKLIDYVFAKPVGELGQEMGGVGLCLLALGEASGLSADGEEARETARVLSKPLEWFHARNEAKNAAGFDASAYPAPSPTSAGGDALIPGNSAEEA